MALLGAIALAACHAPGAAVPSPGTGGTGVAVHHTAATALTGLVQAPPGYRGGMLLSNNGGSLVDFSGSGVISDHGAGLIGKVKESTLAVLQPPLAGAEVRLALADGRPVPGLASVTTDASGRFTFPHVPVGFAFVVVVGVTSPTGKPGALATIARTATSAVDVHIGAASTLAAAGVLRDQHGSLATFDGGAFQSAVTAVDAALTAPRLPDFADPADVLAKLDALKASEAQVDQAVTAARPSPVPSTAAGSDETAIAAAIANLDPASPPPVVASPPPSTEPGLVASATPTSAPASATPTGASPSAGANPASAAPSAPPSSNPTATPTPAPTATPTPAPSPFFGTVSLLAGNGQTGAIDGPGDTASFNAPHAAVVAPNGKVYLTDTANHAIRVIDPSTPDRQVSTLSGLKTAGGVGVTLSQPTAIAADTQGRLYIWDSSTIRRIDPTSLVVTDLGSGPGTPEALVVGPDGKLYIANADNGTIARMDLTSFAITNVAGSGTGFADGPVASAKFRGADGLAFGADGRLYVADGGNQRIRAIDLGAGMVTTVAGTGATGHADGAGTAATFSSPWGMCSRGGQLFVADNGNSAIRGIRADGSVYTLAGGSFGSADGTGAAAQFDGPKGLAAGPVGPLFVVETARVRQVR